MPADAFQLPTVQVEIPQIYARSVAPIIEEAIIYGELQDGARLTEEEICQKMGVSRSPVREALRLLERDGLVVREPRRGVRVSELTVTELDQLYVCRISLESMAARLAAQSATNKEIKAISAAHQACIKALDRDDIREHFRVNVEMSQKLFAASHNRPLIRLLGTIHKQALRYRFLAYKRSRIARENSVRANENLVKALLDRDEEKAAQMARASIEGTHEFIKQCLLERNLG